MENRKKLAILRGENLKSALKRYGLKQADLTRDGMISESQVSSWISGKVCIREETLRDIKEKYLPDVRMDFLLGYDEIMTLEEYKIKWLADLQADSVCTLLEWAINSVCIKENLSRPEFDTLELYLQAQLKDYALMLANGYLHKSKSYSLQWLDYIQSIERENIINKVLSGDLDNEIYSDL